MTEQASAKGPANGADDDCDGVLGRMFEFLDQELDTADADRIRQHLAECEHCLDAFDAEGALKELVHRCCSSETAPTSLKIKIERTLIAFRADEA